MSKVTQHRFYAAAAHVLRQHRDWPGVDEALAEYAKRKRMFKTFKRAAHHHRR